MKVNDVLSNVLLSSTGLRQGCVLSPFLFVLFTNACQSQHAGHHIIKFADDSIIVSLLNHGNTDHGPVVGDFIEWCNSYLSINVAKTKELIVDFSKSPTLISSVTVDNQDVEVVTKYKYLGTSIHDKTQGG